MIPSFPIFIFLKKNIYILIIPISRAWTFQFIDFSSFWLSLSLCMNVLITYEYFVYINMCPNLYEVYPIHERKNSEKIFFFLFCCEWKKMIIIEEETWIFFFERDMKNILHLQYHIRYYSAIAIIRQSSSFLVVLYFF